jgi:hypothetical protein
MIMHRVQAGRENGAARRTVPGGFAGQSADGGIVLIGVHGATLPRGGMADLSAPAASAMQIAAQVRTAAATLEQSTVRGKCLEPLLFAGDIVFLDRMQPESGDLVAFSQSQRYVDLEAGQPPHGQQPSSKGDKWCKLYGVIFCENGPQWEMLFERYGLCATANLLACEYPDDTPVLHPVRNVLRAGKLLYGSTASAGPRLTRRALLLGAAVAPLALSACGDETVPFNMLPPRTDETSGSGLGLNSATVLAIASSTGSGTVSVGARPEQADAAKRKGRELPDPRLAPPPGRLLAARGTRQRRRSPCCQRLTESTQQGCTCRVGFVCALPDGDHRGAGCRSCCT